MRRSAANLEKESPKEPTENPLAVLLPCTAAVSRLKAETVEGGEIFQRRLDRDLDVLASPSSLGARSIVRFFFSAAACSRAALVAASQ